MAIWTSENSPYPLPLQPPDTADQLDRMEEAARTGDLKTVKSLTEEVIRIPDGDFFLHNGGGPLLFAVKKGQVQVVEYFFSQGANFYLQLAEEATRNKDIAMLELLLCHGWNINEPLNPLMPPILTTAILDAKVTKWFLANGANPNEGCGLDLTPLSHAVEYAPMEVIKLLFEGGGSVKHGQLLHHAAYRDLNDQTEVLAYLVEKGIRLNDIMYQNRMDNYKMQRDWGLGTPLHRAAEMGRLEGAKWLVAHGANPRIRNSLGELPIDRAQLNGKSSMVEYLRPVTEQASEPGMQWTDGRQGKIKHPDHIEGVVYL